MFLDRLLNQGNAPLVEQNLRFAAKQHRLIAENIANIDTPGYRQKRLDPEAFHAVLRDRAADRRTAVESGQGVRAVRFDDLASSIDTETPRSGVLFHDRNNRSVEQLMSDLSQNGLTHNLFVELMKRQFSSIENALKERVS